MRVSSWIFLFGTEEDSPLSHIERKPEVRTQRSDALNSVCTALTRYARAWPRRSRSFPTMLLSSFPAARGIDSVLYFFRFPAAFASWFPSIGPRSIGKRQNCVFQASRPKKKLTGGVTNGS